MPKTNHRFARPRAKRAVFHLALSSLLLPGTAAIAQPDDRDHAWDFVTIRDPGNIPYSGHDPLSIVGDRGGVNYEYRIGRYELTSAQWVDFLNAMQLGDEIFGWIPNFWGGTVVATSPHYQFALIGPETAMQPAAGIPWRAAAYYCNWLHNGRPTGFANVQDGAYDASTFTATSSTTVGDQDTRHPNAKYWIPSVDEWLKAVHYDPDRFGANDGGWWDYPYASNDPPTSGWPDEGGETSAGVRGIDNFDADVWRLPLGAYSSSSTPWGLFDASGGGAEWLEDWYAVHIFGKRHRVINGSLAASNGTTSDLVYAVSWAEPDTLAPRYMSFRIASQVASDADMARPYWACTMGDVVAFLRGYIEQSSVSDLAAPYGQWTPNDIGEFVARFVVCD